MGNIVIHGANMAGIFAAKAALSKGSHQVTILEPTGFRGGMPAAGLCLADMGASPNEWGYYKKISQDLADYYAGVSNAEINYSYRFEPKKMTEFLNAFIADDPNITFVYNAEIESVTKVNGIATSVRAKGTDYPADVFIDCSYEGDLMHAAGVTNTYGRESRNMYGESLAGIGYADRVVRDYPMVDAKGNRHDNAQPPWRLPDFAADAKIQGFNFRMIWSDKSDRLPWSAPTRPDGTPYRREDFLDVLNEIQTRGLNNIFGIDWWFKQDISGDLSGGSAANRPRPQAAGKYGINSRDQYGLSWEWPTATWKRRREITATIYYRLAGTLYFVANDASLAGTPIQASAQSFGLCPDEFQGAGNYYGQPGWPPIPYVRESRRMIGQYVLKQGDHGKRGHVFDAVSTASYYIDRHTMQHNSSPDGLSSFKEGHRDAGGYKMTSIPLRAIKPLPGECDNLVVPVCASMSSLFWQPFRMEPTFSMLGQVAGWLAHLAITKAKSTNAVGYSEIRPYLTEAAAITG